MNKFLLLFLSTIFLPHQVSTYAPGLEDVTEVISVVRIGVSLVEYIYKVFSAILKDSGGGEALSNVAENTDISRRLLGEYQVISSALGRLEKGYQSVEHNIAAIQQKLPQDIRQELRLDRVDDLMSSIWSSYLLFNKYQENKDNIEKHTLEDFAGSVISHESTSVRTNLQKLHYLVVPDRQAGGILEEKGIMTLLANGIMNDPFYTCSLGQSPHHFMYSLFNVLALTEIKGYAMIQFSYMIMRLHNKGNFSYESDLARSSFESRVAEKLSAVKKILPKMSKEFRRCDPKAQVEGKTFIRMTNLLQGHIENEIDMSLSQSCSGTCPDFKVSTIKSCYNDLFCAKQPTCENGRLFDCEFYDADATVCLAKNVEGRKYEWIQYEDGTVLGNKAGQCQKDAQKVESWWRWVFWHCTYCLCKCDAPGPNSDRYWSLLPAVTNASENMVVTGVRFVKKKGVIHLEIEQAPATEEGTVNDEQRFWLPANDFSVDNPEMREGKDYMTMKYEERSMDTDTVEAQPGHVITGVRLRKLGGHLNLEVRTTPIDFSTGSLRPDLSVWIANDNTQIDAKTGSTRTKIEIPDPDVPTKYLGTTQVDSETNQFITFDTTSARKDAMQTTIPYIDAQPVTPRDGIWLSGVGLYHKGYPGYGGYVGLMTTTYDFSNHLLPSESEPKSLQMQQLHYEFNPKK